MADQFWRGCIKEYLPLLQKRNKWQTPKKNLKGGDPVFMVDEEQPHGSWAMGLVQKTNCSSDGYVRSCEISTSRGTVTRPITKVCLLEGSNDTTKENKI